MSLYVSSYFYMCPHTPTYVSEYLSMCPSTSSYVFHASISLYMRPHTYICVLIPLYVSSYFYICVLISLPHMCPQVDEVLSSGSVTCLLYMRPHTYICVFIPLYVSSYLYMCLYKCVLRWTTCYHPGAWHAFYTSISLYMRPHTYICVSIPLYVFSYLHLYLYVSSGGRGAVIRERDTLDSHASPRHPLSARRLCPGVCVLPACF